MNQKGLRKTISLGEGRIIWASSDRMTVGVKIKEGKNWTTYLVPLLKPIAEEDALVINMRTDV